MLLHSQKGRANLLIPGPSLGMVTSTVTCLSALRENVVHFQGSIKCLKYCVAIADVQCGYISLSIVKTADVH